MRGIGPVLGGWGVPDPADEIIGLYRRHGLAWAALRDGGTFVEAGWLARFMDLLPAGGSVLDIGCGSGAPIAATLAAAGFAVTGLDTSAPLLGLARARLPHATWIEGDMREMALGRQFDGLLAWDSFFHLAQDDQRRMFEHFAAHAAPGAALMFTSGPEEGPAIGALQGEALFHASLGPREYRALLGAAGFCVVGHVAEDPACGGRTVWLAQRP
jgi:2-polyprenyl-3-methyl-5-hydroxy-6-metoxy-1,4-benzoquinol methylase